MLRSRPLLLVIVFSLVCSVADAQRLFQQVASFDYPIERARRITGGREVEFSKDGRKLIAAYYGSTAQLYDLVGNGPIGKLIRTAGDGEIGFVNDNVAYTADWDSMRLWDANSGEQIGEAIPHELREDTIIRPAIHPDGKRIATRATMKSVQLRDVATRELIGEPLDFSGNVHAIRFSDDGAVLLIRAGGSIHAIDGQSGEEVAGPIKSDWQFDHFSQGQRLVTVEPMAGGLHQLVIHATDQPGWPETHRSPLNGKLKRLIALSDNRVLVQFSKPDYTPGIFTIDLAKPDDRTEVKSNADRAFTIVVPRDGRHWVCSNIHNISGYTFGEAEPVWQMSIPPSGYDQQLFRLDDQHFIIRDKQENFGVHKVADGSQVWTKAGVRRFSLANDRIAFCTNDGVEIWSVE